MKIKDVMGMICFMDFCDFLEVLAVMTLSDINLLTK